jgi:hypothetical protein
MDKSKYGKYIITELKPNFRQAPSDRSPADIAAAAKSHLQLLYLDDTIIRGAFYAECVWIWPGPEHYPTKAEPNAHAHDFDEIITFFGTDFEDPYNLCGEIELWLEDEKHLLTRSCIVFVPKGMKHGPLVIHRVDRPIFHVAAGTGGMYVQGKD